MTLNNLTSVGKQLQKAVSRLRPLKSKYRHGDHYARAQPCMCIRTCVHASVSLSSPYGWDAKIKVSQQNRRVKVRQLFIALLLDLQFRKQCRLCGQSARVQNQFRSFLAHYFDTKKPECFHIPQRLSFQRSRFDSSGTSGWTTAEPSNSNWGLSHPSSPGWGRTAWVGQVSPFQTDHFLTRLNYVTILFSKSNLHFLNFYSHYLWFKTSVSPRRQSRIDLTPG